MPGAGKPRQCSTESIKHSRPSDTGIPFAAIDHGSVRIDPRGAKQLHDVRALLHTIKIFDRDTSAQLRRSPRRRAPFGFRNRRPRMPFATFGVLAGSPIHELQRSGELELGPTLFQYAGQILLNARPVFRMYPNLPQDEAAGAHPFALVGLALGCGPGCGHHCNGSRPAFCAAFHSPSANLPLRAR